MRHRQKGMTLIGWLLVLAIGGLLVTAGLRLVPIYLNHMKVVSTLNKVKDEYQGKAATPRQLETALAKHYNIEGITSPAFKEFKISRRGGVYTITAKYQNRAPYLYNIWFLVDFDKTVEIRR